MSVTFRVKTIVEKYLFTAVICFLAFNFYSFTLSVNAVFIADDEFTFNEGVLSDIEIDQGILMLNPTGLDNGFGEYTSKKHLFHQSTLRTFSWFPKMPYGMELPSNNLSESDYDSYNVDMTGNVLLFDMNSSSVNDKSGNSNNAFCSSVCPTVQDGVLLNALEFTDNGERLEIVDSPELNPVEEITISAWIKWSIDPSTHVRNWSTILSKANDSQYRLQHSMDNTAFEFAVRTFPTSTRFVQSVTTPIQNRWYHVVGTYDGYSARIYVNGVLENTNTFGDFRQINVQSNNLFIGNREQIGGDRAFKGLIDEVSIFDRVLSGSEIYSIYKRGALDLKLQLLVDDNNCDSADFVGFDGTASSFFSQSISTNNLSLNISDVSCLKYKFTFSTIDETQTPVLESVEIDTDPTYIELYPLNESLDVQINEEFSILFDEVISLSSTVDNETFAVKDVLTDTIVQYVEIDNITGIGSDLLVFELSDDLDYDTEYYFYIPSDSIIDNNGNFFIGLLDSNGWKFRTESIDQIQSSAPRIVTGSVIRKEERLRGVDDYTDKPEPIGVSSEVSEVVKRGIIENELRAEANKCEVLMIMSRVFEWDVEGYVSTRFEDVPMWCLQVASFAQDKGIVEGREFTVLGTEGLVSRYEVAVMLYRELHRQGYEFKGTEIRQFIDEIVDWAEEAVMTLVREGIIKGFEDGTFGGTQGILKQDLGVMLLRVQKSTIVEEEVGSLENNILD